MKTWKRIPALLLALVMGLSLSGPALAVGDIIEIPSASVTGVCPFTDVPVAAWYRNDVAAVYQTGIFNGTSDTTFSPNGTLTYAQAVAIAARLHQYSTTGSITLMNGSDVWYEPYVDYMKQNRLIGNDYDKRWDKTITRADMVKILYQGMDVRSYFPLKNTVVDNAIPDVSISESYANQVYAFYRSGILTGGDGNYFNPQTTIQRCEVATILNRMLNPDQRKSVTMMEVISFPPTPEASAKPEFVLPAGVPAYDAPLTLENVLALLDYYDPDGAFILRESMAARPWEDPMKYWVSSGTTAQHLTGMLMTCVHEQCHIYQSSNIVPKGMHQWILDTIYIGDKKAVLVDAYDLKMDGMVFDTHEMISTIPDTLRTFRFNTYPNAASDGSNARGDGAFGLLCEFNAYCWEMNTAVRLFDYLAANESNQIFANHFTAYAEFRYWILHYMLYAKEHHPDTYQGILANDEFRQAFTTTEQLFAGFVQEYFDKMETCGKEVYQPFQDEYDLLMTEMQKPEYVQMMALLQP